MDYFEEQRTRRAEAYPTQEEALAVMNDAYARLCDLGWKQPIYFQHHTDPTTPIASTVIGSPQLHHRTGSIHGAAILWIEQAIPRQNPAMVRFMLAAVRRHNASIDVAEAASAELDALVSQRGKTL